MIRYPSPSYSITLRLEIENRIGMFSQIASAISEAGGDLGAIDIVRVEKGKIVSDEIIRTVKNIFKSLKNLIFKPFFRYHFLWT